MSPKDKVPPSVQGELQGALTSVTSITSMIGPVIYTWIFSHVTTENAFFHFPGAPYLLATLFVFTAWLVMVFLVHPSTRKEIRKNL